MPWMNDEFDRTVIGLELDPERSGVFSPGMLMLDFSAADLRAFNDCVSRVAPGTPALEADQLVGAARHLLCAVGKGNVSRFIEARMRRVGEIPALLADAAWTLESPLLGRMQDLLGYIDGPVALVPLHEPAIGGLDRALLVDLAMQGLRSELDEYADFRRWRVAEAAALGVPVQTITTTRAHWLAERSEELRLERLARESREIGLARREGGNGACSVSAARADAEPRGVDNHGALAARRAGV